VGEAEGEGGRKGGRVEEGGDEVFAGGCLIEHALGVLGEVDPVLESELGKG